MKTVTLCLEFRGGRGHAYVTVLPSEYGIEKISETGCLEYNLPAPGTYNIMFEGVSPEGGTKASLQVDGLPAGTKNIKNAGPYSRFFEITI